MDGSAFSRLSRQPRICGRLCGFWGIFHSVQGAARHQSSTGLSVEGMIWTGPVKLINQTETSRDTKAKGRRETKQSHRVLFMQTGDDTARRERQKRSSVSGDFDLPSRGDDRKDFRGEKRAAAPRDRINP